jgi:hypothetical protein
LIITVKKEYFHYNFTIFYSDEDEDEEEDEPDEEEPEQDEVSHIDFLYKILI